MKEEEIVSALKKTLAKPLAWYEEHKADEDYVYDEAYSVFDNQLMRGDFQRILWLLSSSNTEHKEA